MYVSETIALIVGSYNGLFIEEKIISRLVDIVNLTWPLRALDLGLKMR